jgi:hypothetical protein
LLSGLSLYYAKNEKEIQTAEQRKSRPCAKPWLGLEAGKDFQDEK